MNILDLLLRKLVQVVDNEIFTESIRRIIEQHNENMRGQFRLTSVAGEGAISEHSEGARTTRPSPEP
jgi:hypothetical protein